MLGAFGVCWLRLYALSGKKSEEEMIQNQCYTFCTKTKKLTRYPWYITVGAIQDNLLRMKELITNQHINSSSQYPNYLL